MSNYQQSYDLLADLNTMPPYTTAEPPVTTDTGTVSVEEEASLQRELDWWQSVEFGTDGLSSAATSRKPSTTSEIAGKEFSSVKPQQQLQERLRQEASATSHETKKTDQAPVEQTPISVAMPDAIASDLNHANLLRSVLGLQTQGVDPTTLAALMLQQQQQQQQQQERAAQALLTSAFSQNVPFNFMASLQAFNAGLLGALAAPSTFTSAMQPTALLNAQLAASNTVANNSVQLPVTNIPSTVNAMPSLPVSSIGSPVTPTADTKQRQATATTITTTTKRRSPSPIRPAIPVKRISLSPSPPASSPVMTKPILSPDEDKRRRNTAASARFRLKKKQREQQLEKTAQCMTERVQVLEERLREFEQENRWLRSLVIEKDPMLLGEGDGKRARLVEVDAQASAGGGANPNTEESVSKV